ncbi:hypothetical protein RUM43_011722 [Polyplax serrata]|uniref:Uncharacterized protein n=1 Tax=Polyplax serrata TaxID=468196 RepID=A0AAN8P5S4_POLSC
MGGVLRGGGGGRERCVRAGESRKKWANWEEKKNLRGRRNSGEVPNGDEKVNGVDKVLLEWRGGKKKAARPGREVEWAVEVRVLVRERVATAAEVLFNSDKSQKRKRKPKSMNMHEFTLWSAVRRQMSRSESERFCRKGSVVLHFIKPAWSPPPPPPVPFLPPSPGNVFTSTCVSEREKGTPAGTGTRGTISFLSQDGHPANLLPGRNGYRRVSRHFGGTVSEPLRPPPFHSFHPGCCVT